MSCTCFVLEITAKKNACDETRTITNRWVVTKRLRRGQKRPQAFLSYSTSTRYSRLGEVSFGNRNVPTGCKIKVSVNKGCIVSKNGPMALVR